VEVKRLVGDTKVLENGLYLYSLDILLGLAVHFADNCQVRTF
jgi:hypothetical protein